MHTTVDVKLQAILDKLDCKASSPEKLIEQWQFMRTVQGQLGELAAQLEQGKAKLELLEEFGYVIDDEAASRCFHTRGMPALVEQANLSEGVAVI